MHGNKHSAANPKMTRPFPQESVYNGDGNTTDAANFACKVVK